MDLANVLLPSTPHIFPSKMLTVSFLLLNLGLFWVCANAMIHSFDTMLTWGQSFLSPHFTGLILIPVASTLAEVSPFPTSVKLG